MTETRIPGFCELTVAERRDRICEINGISPRAMRDALEGGGLDVATADQLIENVIGTYALPLGVALNFTVNGRDVLVPMAVEEPSVVAAASNAARMVRAGGGFRTQVLETLVIGQIELRGVSAAATQRLTAAREELLAIATGAASELTRYGGGPRDLVLRQLGPDWLVLHVLVDCQNAMGANMVNTIVEAVAPRAAELASGRIGLRIVSNLADRRRVKVSCQVPLPALVRRDAMSGLEVAQAIEAASRFAEADPYRATTHNKGIMNGIDAVVVATGNDFRAVEAGAHAYAARSGSYRPLSIWRVVGEELSGELETPLALGVIGGTLRLHPAARLALQLLGDPSANQLAEVTASAGLATNLAALRALSTEGIQRGHMALHARSAAISKPVGTARHEANELTECQPEVPP